MPPAANPFLNGNNLPDPFPFEIPGQVPLYLFLSPHIYFGPTDVTTTTLEQIIPHCLDLDQYERYPDGFHLFTFRIARRVFVQLRVRMQRGVRFPPIVYAILQVYQQREQTRTINRQPLREDPV